MQAAAARARAIPAQWGKSGRLKYNRFMQLRERFGDHVFVFIISSVIIFNAFLFFLSRDQTFVHIDAIAHVNKARGLFDNLEPGIRQLGTVWLPLPHLLMAPLAAIDPFWRSGAAGSGLRVVCPVSTQKVLVSGRVLVGRVP